MLDRTLNQNEFQPGVVVGTRVIQPFVNTVFTATVEAANARRGTACDTVAEYSHYRVATDVEQLAGARVRAQGGDILLSPMLEVVRWPGGACLRVDFMETLPVGEVRVNLGVKSAEGWRFEGQEADGTWCALPVAWQGEEMVLKVDAPLRAVRVSNASTELREVFLKKFLVRMRR